MSAPHDATRFQQIRDELFVAALGEPVQTLAQPPVTGGKKATSLASCSAAPSSLIS